jgi:ABC-2 type transport system permease protein
MSSPMFWLAIKNLRWTVLWYAFGLALYGAIIVSVYPMFRGMMTEFQELIDRYPEAVLRAFGLEGDFASFPAFLGVEYMNVIWPLIVSIFVIMAGTATVAQEIERGTADLWLSVPEERWRLLLDKSVALLLGIVVLAAVTVVSIGVGGALIDEWLGFRPLIALSVVLLGFPFAVLGYSVFLSSLFSERGKAAGIAAAFTILSYLAWLVAGLAERWEWLRYVSTFTAFKPQMALESGQIPLLETLVLVAIGLAALAAALAIFQRRDVATV